MKKINSLQALRHRKAVLLAPLLVLPFLTLFFWAMGGGRGTDLIEPTSKGFNLQLPDAKLDDRSLDKMHYYDLADKDSAERATAISKDPLYIRDSTGLADADSLAGRDAAMLRRSALGAANGPEQRVYRKLDELRQVLEQPSPKVQAPHDPVPSQRRFESSAEIERLEQMMATMDALQPADPEMEQINGMLENILDLQYPERAAEKIRKASQAQRGQVFPVATGITTSPIGTLDGGSLLSNASDGNELSNGFYSLDDAVLPNRLANAVRAEIYQYQTVSNGSVVKMRLAEDIFINGVRVLKNSFVYGTAALKGERLHIAIGSLQSGNSIYPVDLSVYDLDGMEGVYIPGAIARDVAKSSADRSIQEVGLTTIDDSWKTQAAGAGIEAAKGLFSKNVKLIKVNLKAGYRVLLRDGKQKEPK